MFLPAPRNSPILPKQIADRLSENTQNFEMANLPFPQLLLRNISLPAFLSVISQRSSER